MNGNDTTKLYDPNGELSAADAELVLMSCGGPFCRCRIKPQVLEGFPSPALVYGDMGRQKHLVYVRVTHDEAEEVGTGPMPLVLIDKANELGAVPHVTRINLSRTGDGVAFKYWGVDELEAELKADTEAWNDILLRGRSMDDYVRLTKGKVNKLNIALDLSRIERSEPRDEHDWNGVVMYGLNTVPRVEVDGQRLPLAAVDVLGLMRSTMASGEYWIPTCDCGEPGCAGIDRGVDVVHDKGLVLWRGYGLRPRRVFLFDRAQYREAVLKGAREFIELYRQHGGNDFSAYFIRFSYLEKALFEAEGQE